jgi:NitT/TauT family transport system ATP-binding protein
MENGQRQRKGLRALMLAERAPVKLELRPELDLARVSKSYGRGHHMVDAVADVSLSVAHNEFVSILGPSGCGKSTLMLLIGGLATPSSGAISLNGRPVTGPRRTNGIVFQNPVLLPWRTVLDNVLLPIELMGERVADYIDHAHTLLEMAGISEFADRLPHELSGGMRQRAGICRALVQHPTLLLMDEPFSALDAMTRDDMNIELLRLWEQDRKTVVFITHSIAEAIFLSDRVVVMSKRPARILEEIGVPLPRPRTVEMQETPQFTQLRAHIRNLIQR